MNGDDHALEADVVVRRGPIDACAAGDLASIRVRISVRVIRVRAIRVISIWFRFRFRFSFRFRV